MAEHAHITTVRRPEDAGCAFGRRPLLAGLSALLAAPVAAVSAPRSDAALLAMRDSVVAHARRWTAMSEEACELDSTTPRWFALDAALRAMVEPIHALGAQMADTPAATLPGLQAKAEAVRLRLSAWDTDTEPMNPDDALAWSLAQDVLRLVGGAA